MLEHTEKWCYYKNVDHLRSEQNGKREGFNLGWPGALQQHIKCLLAEYYCWLVARFTIQQTSHILEQTYRLLKVIILLLETLETESSFMGRLKTSTLKLPLSAMITSDNTCFLQEWVFKGDNYKDHGKATSI